jgi:hypothetical protein
MSTPLVTYNSAKLAELQQEISNIPVSPAYDSQTTPITLDPSRNNHGTVQQFARGNHTHYLDLDDINMDLKLPVKILDDQGRVKKVILEKSLNSTLTSSYLAFYLKFPFIIAESTNEHPVISMNFSLIGNYPPGVNIGTSFCKTLIYTDSDAVINAEIDMSLNHGKYYLYSKSIVYYTDSSSVRHYYLKLTIYVESGNGKYYDVHYTDISTNKTIPEEFNYDNMLLTILPGTEVAFTSAKITAWSTALDAVRYGNGGYQAIITGSSSTSPGNTHRHLYPDSAEKWTMMGQIGTSGYYIWKYSGS